MNTRQRIKHLGGGLLLSAMMAFGSPSQAELVTQLIHFDDATTVGSGTATWTGISCLTPPTSNPQRCVPTRRVAATAVA